MVAKVEKPNYFVQDAQNIIDVPVDKEVAIAYMEYSISVVYSRAVPDARDGLKPVARRILYSMWEEGFTPEKNYVKSIRPVGSTMANYHPHGDTSIYDAMVKLAQPFYLYVPLVDGYGNWGDVGGSSAAAARYTEARLQKAAMYLLEELKEGTVDTRLNYDGEHTEPVVLPVQFPNLLINGSFGIAVGFSTNMAPHNPTEVIDAARWLLTHPSADLDKLMTYIPGPDFPNGGQIIGMDGIREAYETGNGTIRIRSTVTIEPAGRGRYEIIFTEMPYGVKTDAIVTKVKEGIKDGKLQGVSDIKDLTDMDNGTRLIVETKTGVNPQALLLDLYKNTPLESTFTMNNIALVDGSPKLVGLKEQLEIFLAHRVDVVTRRCEFRLAKKQDRLHLLEGLSKALNSIDDVIKLVRGAEDGADAETKLMGRFKLDQVQAAYILTINLRRLTKYDTIELDKESTTLREEIKELRLILGDEKVLRALIGDELEVVRKALDTPRRSVLVGGNLAEHVAAAAVASAASAKAIEVADDPCLVLLSSTGLIARTPAASEEADTARRKNGRAKHDGIIGSVTTTVRSRVLLITSKGRAFKVDVLTLPALPVASGTVTLAAGMPSSDVVALEKGETIVGIAPVEAPEGSPGIAMGTRDGIVKVAAFDWPLRSDEFDIMGLKDDDEILYATLLKDGKEEIVFITEDSSLLHFPASKVRPQGKSGGGVQGISLAAGSKVLAFNAVNLTVEGDDEPRVVTSTGLFAKVTPLREYPSKGRASSGIRSMRWTSKSGNHLTVAWVGSRPVASTDKGDQIPLPDVDLRRDGSGVANAAFAKVGSLLERS